MRTRFEFSLYPIAPRDVASGVDPTLALMGAQGWEIRGLAHTLEGGLTVALQRPLDEQLPLPDGQTLAASLEEPLVAPAPTSWTLSRSQTRFRRRASGASLSDRRQPSADRQRRSAPNGRHASRTIAAAIAAVARVSAARRVRRVVPAHRNSRAVAVMASVSYTTVYRH